MILPHFPASGVLFPAITAAVAVFLGVMPALAAADAGSATPAKAGPVPAEIRARFKLAGFYQKFVDADGLPIVGSAKVSDAALAECAWLVRKITAHRPEILRTLGKANVRFAVMAYNEFTTDIPEHSDLTPASYWNRRARGLGPSEARPAVSGGEENLLAFPGDPYDTENIPLHEFAHAIHLMAMPELDPTFDARLLAAYKAALAAGLWKNTYAATNHAEYWAEGVQSWFDNNRENDDIHNHVDTRAELKEYDPALAALCAEVLGDLPWRYQKPDQRPEEDRRHLAGIMPSPAPVFVWPQTSGDIKNDAEPAEQADAASPATGSASGTNP